MSDIIYLLIPAVLVLLFRFIITKNKPPIFGIYQLKNKNYWFKLIFMYVVLKTRQLKLYLTRLPPDLKCEGQMHVEEQDVNIETCYDLGDFSKAVDAVYFNGMSETGEAVICNVARRPQRVCDSFLYLKLDGVDVLLTPSLPDTYLKKSSEDDDEYEVQGLSISNVIPMRSWKVTYKGAMKTRGDESKVKVEAKLIWSAISNPFNFDAHMSAWSMASDIARENWSPDYFRLLKKYHQTHYEQVGYMTGTVVVDGNKHEIYDMTCMRDHSFGALREWRNFHRYVYHFIFLDNGDYIAVGSISQPSVLSHLIIGYYYRKSDQSMAAVESSEKIKYFPRIMDSASEQVSGETYVVKVQEKDDVSFYIGKDREAKFYEKWCVVEVNGLGGCACVEWQYNHVVRK